MSGSGERPHFRAFVAIALPPALLDCVQEQQQHLARKVEGVRWVARDQLHLTLKFYGNVASSDTDQLTAALAEAAQSVSEFELSVRGFGAFPSVRRPSVLWFGLAGELETLHRLQEAVEKGTDQFGSHSENRTFHPHLTIGRIKDPRAAWRVGEALGSAEVGELGGWCVRKIDLIQSRLSPKGSTYTTLASLPLNSPHAA